MKQGVLTAERARELLAYKPDTGLLRWRVRMGSRAAAGSVATSFCKPSGYFQVRIDGVNYQQHRVIWLMVHGTWPFQIDHRNRVRSDNRLENLRETCDALNRQNVEKARKDSTSGIQGVHVDKRTGAFIARIRVNGRYYQLGAHKSAEAASTAYLSAKAQLHPAWVPVGVDLAHVPLTDNHLLNRKGERRIRSDSRSGIVGVFMQAGKWRARFKRKYLGAFDSPQAASVAVTAARAASQTY